MRSKNGTNQVEIGIAFFHGYVSAQLESFARGISVPSHILAARLGTLLLGQTGRELLGTEDPVPDMRGTTTAARKPMEPMAVAGGTHGGKTPRVKRGKRNWFSKLDKSTQQEIIAKRKRTFAATRKQKATLRKVKALARIADEAA